VKNTKGDRRYWICAEKGCKATINTNGQSITKLGHTSHNHGSSPHQLVADSIIRGLKRKCQDDSRPLPVLYDEELSTLRSKEFIDDHPDHNQILQSFPTFEGCKTALYHSRSKTRPTLPLTRHQIQLDGRWTETLAGERFLLADEGDVERILIFATDDNLHHLSRAEIIYGDGTFYASPNLFTQLYSLHADVDGSIYPLVFAPLPGKSETIYTRFLQLLKDECLRRRLPLRPLEFFADFENAARKAIKTVFPSTELRGCFFHFTQCIWRKTQSLGLAVPYKEDQDIQRFIRRAAVLPLIPIRHVEDVWFNALEEIEDHHLDVTRFADYVTDYWIENHQPAEWNHFNTEGPRTTNNIEGWHSRINKKLTHGHPNIFTVVDLLQKEQAVTEAHRVQISAGGTRKLQRKKYKRIDARLTTLKRRFIAGNIRLMDYADAASHLLHLD
ncbi:hypothetical protein FSP39_021128, partial [Pinctada imbricata]